MADAEVSRAAERVMLACKALAAAANDLRIAQAHTGMTAVDDAADLVGAETERVCELAEDLASLASNLGGLSALRTRGGPATSPLAGADRA